MPLLKLLYKGLPHQQLLPCLFRALEYSMSVEIMRSLPTSLRYPMLFSIVRLVLSLGKIALEGPVLRYREKLARGDILRLPGGQ